MFSCCVFSRVCLCLVFLFVRERPPLWRGFVTEGEEIFWTKDSNLSTPKNLYTGDSRVKFLQIVKCVGWKILQI